MAHAAPVSPEPNTPLWLTCLGAGLFFLVGLFLVFGAPLAPRLDPSQPVAAPVASAAAAPAPRLGAAAAPGSPPQGRPAEQLPKGIADRMKQAPAAH